MKEFFNVIIPLPMPYQLIAGGLATFAITCIGIAGKNYLKASEEFRNTIYTVLEGVFPNVVVYLSDGEKMDIAIKSITRINTAGVKFQHSLPFFFVERFKKALNHYCETARKTNWQEESARKMYDKMEHTTTCPGEVFRNSVKTLLKFAK